MTHCYTCELTARRHAGQAPLWDDIYHTEYWDVAHAYNTALPGWLVLVTRRHIEALDELTEAEAVDLQVPVEAQLHLGEVGRGFEAQIRHSPNGMRRRIDREVQVHVEHVQILVGLSVCRLQNPLCAGQVLRPPCVH